jgi:hypothetical protein
VFIKRECVSLVDDIIIAKENQFNHQNVAFLHTDLKGKKEIWRKTFYFFAFWKYKAEILCGKIHCRCKKPPYICTKS